MPLLIYKPKMLSLHTNLSFLQEILEKSEIAVAYDDAGEMKDLDAEIRDAAFKAEARIEMELRSIYLAKGWTKRICIKASLLRLGGIFKQAVKQTDYLKKKLIKISAKQLAKGPSQGERITGVSLHGMLRLFSHFKLLRVVDIECISSHEFGVLHVLANLIHLRYLALRYSKDIFPICFCLELFEHSNIQTFIVPGCRAIVDSSKAYGIWKMPLLRNFCVDRIFSLGNSSFVHTKLEGISWLDSKLCTKDLFTRIPNLKKLGIDGGYVENNLDCFYNFVHLGQLEELSIKEWSNFNHIPCSGIPWATSFLRNLKKLKFHRTWLAWSEIRLIGMLPNLEILKLIEACLDREWEPCEGGFRQLKRLVIESNNLRDWNAVGDHFPMLECLELYALDYLQEIPSGFADITTLALIQLNCCWDSVLTSAKLIQEEQYSNYGNTLLVRSENIMVSFYPSNILCVTI
nr:putative late blight resistance protein homolog R1A-10 isoform X1 [Ipomoea batatas]